MNGNSGIVPTVDLATNNNAFPYPVMYGNGGFGGNNGFLGGDGWIILLLLLAFSGNWGNNGNGGFFGGNSFDNGYAWLSNGQKEIMQNTNNGFDTLHLSNQIEGVRDGVYGLSNQMCNSTSDIVSAVNNGFSSAEISANARQIANMNQAFNNQIADLQAFNNLGSQLASCCCENRLGIANLNSTILAENCADRAAIASMKDLQASQVAQNAFIAQGFANEVDQLYNRLANCPVPSTPVYGRTPIFTCNNNGCGCGYNTTSQFI